MNKTLSEILKELSDRLVKKDNTALMDVVNILNNNDLYEVVREEDDDAISVLAYACDVFSDTVDNEDKPLLLKKIVAVGYILGYDAARQGS